MYKKNTSDNNKNGGALCMRKYSYQKNKKNRKEKIGFFTAFSVCLIAVGLALWSTYSSIGGFDNSNVTEPTYIAYLSPTQPVDNPVTGVTVTEYVEPQTTQLQETTEAFTEEREPVVTSSVEPYTGNNESLQTMLQVSASLDYPVTSSKILKEYSMEVLYSETMGDYRVHTGVDFKADIGENVRAMCDGVVEEIYEDSMYGWVIKIVNGNFAVYYCGMSEEVYCDVGDAIYRDDVIGRVGEIPCESKDPMHLHIEVRVGDKTIDPMLIVSSDE